MREAFTSKPFRSVARERIRIANEIVEEYQRMGLRLTLRQLFYQFVSHYGLANKQKEYKNLGQTISEARLCGLIDWDAIEDRVRVPRAVPDWPSIDQCVDEAAAGFRLDRWEGQENYAELWVEKDALAGVLEPLASEFHVTMMVNRGYSSQSAMYESSKRFLSRGRGKKGVHLFYLGDHDPSGEDMVRDISERLRMFGCKRVRVQKIALTMPQVEEHEPPPNPAKMTDARAPAYVEKHGDLSWEVDALDPDTLQGLIRAALSGVLDRAKFDAMIEREARERAKLARALRWARGNEAGEAHHEHTCPVCEAPHCDHVEIPPGSDDD